MSAVEINDVILRTDERIKLKIDVSAVNALILEDISSLWSAYRVLLKDPNARSLGEYSENRAVALAAMKAEIDDMLGDASSGGVGGVTVIATMEPI